MNDSIATVTNIQRLSLDDGPGIRSTVFLKGCPLRCLWCHNPENINPNTQIQYTINKCKQCMTCVNLCPKQCYRESDGKVTGNWETCTICGKCVNNCVYGALELKGEINSVEQIVEKVVKDKMFYDESNGGVTISGGEPMIRPNFMKNLLRSLKENGIHTAVDTCGFVQWEYFESVMENVDLFLYDIKAWKNETHIRLTGKPNKIILENLRKLSSTGNTIFIRMPIIKNLNDDCDDIKRISEFISECSGIKLVEVLPYHDYGIGKYKGLNMNYSGYEFEAPDKRGLDEIRKILMESGKDIRIKEI